MIGKSIKKFRKLRKRSQGDVCKKLNITQSYLSMVETNKKNASLKTIKEIAKYLDVPVALMFWYALEDKEIKKDKREVFNMLKPTIDEFIISVFNNK